MNELRPQSTPSFRRRLVVAPRRRAHPLVRLLGQLVKMGLVLLPAGGVAAWVLLSPAFSLRTLEVSGNRRVRTEWVAEALRPDLGRNLVRLDLGAVHQRLKTHPWIRSVELRKRLPHHLRVEVVEHRASALLQVGDELVFVSDEGELITPYDGPSEGIPAGPPPPHLVIAYRLPFADQREKALGLQAEGPTGGESRPSMGLSRRAAADADVAGEGAIDGAPELRRALALARRLEKRAVAWSEDLERIEILGEEDYLLRVGSLPFPILVRADISDGKARTLDELLPQILARFEPLEAIDLRFSRRIVVKGAAQPPRQGTG